MKNLFKYEINESIAAKAAMNCVHKRLFKEHMGLPTPQKEVVLGEYDPYEWEMDAYGNGSKRELVHQALFNLHCTQTVKDGWKYNNKIQELIDKHNPKIANIDNAEQFVRNYASDLGVVIPKPEAKSEISEQEETDYTNDDIPSYHFSYQNSFLVWAMRHVIPYLKEMSQVCAKADPTELKHAVMKVLKEEGRFGAPESERGCEHWAEEKRWKVEEFLGGDAQEQEEHSEDYDNLQSQLANAWDEGMEDDYVPYENKFDETHNDLVDTLLRAVEHYFDYEEDVSGFYRFNYTEDQLGKAVEQILDKYGDFPSSNNFDKCYDWAEKHAEELMKILETGSLENTYEGHPEFGFSEQEEMEVTDAKHALAEMVADELRYPDGDLDKIYNIISDIIAKEGYSPDPDDYDDWLDEHFDEIHDLMVGGTISENEEEDYGMNDLRKWRDSLDLSNNDDDDADEETYTDDSQGIEMIIDLMVTKNMISDGERTRQIAKQLIQRKLNEEGMWIGEDAREAERFVEFFGEDMAEEIAHWRW